MASINISTNKKEIEIIRDGEHVGNIYFSPSDVAILSRMRKARERLPEIKMVPDDDVDKALDEAERVDTEVRALIDYIFDYPCSDVVFGSGFSFTTENGASAVEMFLNGALEIISEAIGTEAKAAEERQAKYLEKYRK